MLRLKDVLGATVERAIGDQEGKNIRSTYFSKAILTDTNNINFFTPDETSSSITIPYAQSGKGGLVSNTTQTFSGKKIYENKITMISGMGVSKRSIDLNEKDKLALIGTIKLQSGYVNSPIVFEFHRRQDNTTTTCYIRFSNTASATNAIPSIFASGVAHDAIYLMKASSVDNYLWYLYIYSEQTYDTISISRLQLGDHSEAKNVVFNWYTDTIESDVIATDPTVYNTVEELSKNFDKVYQSSLGNAYENNVIVNSAKYAKYDSLGNEIGTNYLSFTSALNRSIGTETINYYAYNGKGDQSNTALFSIPAASTAGAGLITTSHQRLAGTKVFDNNIVLNHSDQQPHAIIFANNANTEDKISAYASWRLVYHATDNILGIETGGKADDTNINNWYSVLRLHPVTTSTSINLEKYGSIDIFGNTTITHGEGPRIYFTNPELTDESGEIEPTMKGWVGLSQSNNRLGIYDTNAKFYLIRNYSTTTSDKKYLSSAVSTEGSFYVMGTSDGTEETRNLFVRMGYSLNDKGTNQIGLRVNTDLEQGLWTSYGKWLIYFDPQSSLYRLYSPSTSYFVGSKDYKSGMYLGAQRQWPDIDNADGTTTKVKNYSEMYMGIGPSGKSMLFQIAGFDSTGTAMKDTDDGNPNIIYYMNNTNFYATSDGTIGLGGSSHRWQYLYSRYLYSRIDWDDYNTTIHNTPALMPLSIYLLSNDTSLTSIEDTKSPGIGFATGSAASKLRGSLILNQEGFKFKDSQNNGYRAIHADSLILYANGLGENGTGNIVFNHQAAEGTISPNYLRLPYSHGQIALMISETVELSKAALVADEISIYPGSNATFDVGTSSKQWRDGYFKGTLFLTNTKDADDNILLDPSTRNGPALVIGNITDTHLELDGNEIIAKIANTDTENKGGTLNLNTESGLVQIGPGGLKAKEKIEATNINNTTIGSFYSEILGTTSATGKAVLTIGNGSNSTTANNAQGYLRIYGSNKGYTDIVTGTANTSNYTMYLPGATGQFVYHTNDTQIGSNSLPVFIENSGKATAISNLALGSRSSNDAATIRTSRKFSDTDDTNNTSFVLGVTKTGTSGYLQVIRYTDAAATTGSANALYLFELNNIHPNTDNTQTLGTSSYKWSTVYATTFSGNASTATKLAAKVALKVGSTSKDFDGSAALTWTHAEIGATVSNTWTAGTTAGPTIKTTVNGVAGTAVAIPSASSDASGVVTTGTQTFAGTKTFSNNIYLGSKGHGFYLKDKNDTSYPGVYDNGTNLWIGSTASSATHHVGSTYISSGYNGTTGNETVFIAIPNAENTAATSYGILHKGNYTDTLDDRYARYGGTAVGTATLPVYVNSSGLITACTASSVFSSLTWTGGKIAGPTLNITVAGHTRTAVIPTATASASGIITTDTQSFAGSKTFTGALNIQNSASWSLISLCNTNMDKAGLQLIQYTPVSSGAITSNRFYVRTYSYTTGTQTRTAGYEDYRLPAVAPDLTADTAKSYSILTSKEAVTTAQGGTGNSSFTSGRLIYTSSATKLSSSNIAIDTYNLTAVASNTSYYAWKLGNANGTISLYAAVNRGIYDNTNDKWLIYTNDTDRAIITKTLHLAKTADLSGTADNSPALVIGDIANQHLEFDTNEIHSKATGTTVSSLNLNVDGGQVVIGTGGLASYGSISAGKKDSTTGSMITSTRKGTGTNDVGTFGFGVSSTGQSGYIQHTYIDNNNTANSTSGAIYYSSSNFRPSVAGTTTLGTSTYTWKNIYVSTKGAKSGQALANLGMVYSASEPTTKYEGLVWLCPA